MVTAINRTGVAEMVSDMFEADTTILYGSDKLVQIITFDRVLFEKAKVDLNNKYKMFIDANPKDTIEKRSQNCDELYTLNYRIEGIHSDPDESAKIIDQIDEQVSVLIDAQCYNGDLFTDYYTDSKHWDG